MRLLYVVPRYGPQAAGGAEGACRSFATRMAARGSHGRGRHELRGQLPRLGQRPPRRRRRSTDGVTVHRLPVGRAARPRAVLGGLDARARPGGYLAPAHVQHAWLARARAPPRRPRAVVAAQRGSSSMSPSCCRICTSPRSRRSRRSPVGCRSSSTRARTTSRRSASRVYERLFRLSDALGFFTEEEAALVRRRFRVERPSLVTGIGVDIDDADDRLRTRSTGLGERPYVVCVGRIDPGKGTLELVEWFGRYKDAHPGPLALVLVGDRANEVRAASRRVPHRCRRRADAPGDRRGQHRVRAAVALRELLARAHGGMGGGQGSGGAGTQPRARRSRPAQRRRAAVSQRGGARRRCSICSWARRGCEIGSATAGRRYVHRALSRGRRCSGVTSRWSTGHYPRSRPPSDRGSRCPAP